MLPCAGEKQVSRNLLVPFRAPLVAPPAVNHQMPHPGELEDNLVCVLKNTQENAFSFIKWV